ncbi:MAG TPA: hypothetical protein VF703_03660 [Pyrinomonadaceae bacterium]|jgi:hypothetical protein
MIYLILSIFLTSSFGSQTTIPQLEAEARVERLIRQLENEKTGMCTERIAGCFELESFVATLKSGQRGEGVKYGWMSKLHQLGIKQVDFTYEFSWHREGVRFKFEKIDFFRKYYVPKSLVIERQLLRQIRDDGLEQELKDFVVAHLKKQYGSYKVGNVRRGDDNITLFDDEALPFMSWVH